MEEYGVSQQIEDLVVDSLFADLGEITLLLPMSAVAEVVMDVNVVTVETDVDWLHGWIDWRDLKLPLVAYEQLAGSNKMEMGSDPKVLVLNTLGKGKGVDFYAILLNGLPHPSRISEKDEIKTFRSTVPNDYVQMKVELHGQEAIIPDLKALERFVRASAVSYETV